MRDLPPDILLFHIVPKLPANSVVRFTCVSKRWYRFLRTPVFKKLHQHHIANYDHQSHQKLLVFSTNGRPFRFRTIDCEAPEKGLTTHRSFPCEADSYRVRILTSCHGLVCVGIRKKNWYENDFKFIMFWNPLTGEHKKLSSNKHCKLFQGKAYGLYYNSSDDDYRLLHVTDSYDSTVYIYSLRTDSWRMVDARNNFENIPRLISEQWTLSNFLNGNLYFLKQGKSSSRSTGSVIMFDTKNEKFTEIEAPPSFEDRDIKCLSLTVQKGQIHLCVMYDIGVIGYSIKTYFEVWEMNDDRDWRKVASYRHPPDDIGGLQPLHLMKNGNWLMIHNPGYHVHPGIYKVDMEKNTKKGKGKGKDKDMDKSFLFNLADILSIPQKEKYIETFVSPNRYEK